MRQPIPLLLLRLRFPPGAECHSSIPPLAGRCPQGLPPVPSLIRGENQIGGESLRILAELTLALVLFTDSANPMSKAYGARISRSGGSI